MNRTLLKWGLVAGLAAAWLSPAHAANLTWTPLASTPGSSTLGMWLMQDGSIVAQLGDAKTLSRLTPDASGNYANGSWSPAGNFLLKKKFYASAVLSDGRLVACGGEYSGANLDQTETKYCEVYDPIAQTSTHFASPPGWTNIGDAPSAILPDGSMLIGNTQGMGNQSALLDPSTLSWTIVGGDSDNEQGYTLLQTGDVLTAELYSDTSMRYDPSAAAFVQDAPVPVQLANTVEGEIGPSMTLMDGRVIWFGASGHNAIYTAGGEGQMGSWAAAPDLPLGPVYGDQLVADDVPAILEPNGKVLLIVSGAQTPSMFVEYLPGQNSFVLVDNGPTGFNREYTRMLTLPSGDGLVALSDGTWYDVGFASGGAAAWAPAISSFPSTVQPGQTVTLSGTQLSGRSECSTFGDDNQQVENYPSVRATDANGYVTYLRAHDVSTRSIAPHQAGSVSVDIPPYFALQSYSVQVVTCGVASQPVSTVAQCPPIIPHCVPCTGGAVQKSCPYYGPSCTIEWTGCE